LYHAVAVQTFPAATGLPVIRLLMFAYSTPQHFAIDIKRTGSHYSTVALLQHQADRILFKIIYILLL
jgi:hypothetical protein